MDNTKRYSPLLYIVCEHYGKKKMPTKIFTGRAEVVSINHIIKESLKDCSTSVEFVFALRCEECGHVWKSIPVRFSKAGMTPPTEGKEIVYRILWEKEKEMALQRAVKQAEKNFSRCPICHRLVCDHCFLICDELDMCIDCAKRLQECGEPVAENGKSDI